MKVLFFDLDAQNSIPYSEAITFMKQVYKLINTVTNEILGESMITLPKFDFQRIRIVLDGYEKVNLEQYVSQSMRYQVSIHNTAIITSIGATKENALELLIKYYNITADSVISFGDDTNDIGMLKASGIGVAMGNALQEVKEVADYITLTNNEDGVAEYIEKFILTTND